MLLMKQHDHLKSLHKIFQEKNYWSKPDVTINSTRI